jgi:flagellar hook protein FlgE
MSILTALHTGVSGLSGQGDALSIFGDNIANSSTTGFKASRPQFEDVVDKSIRGLLGGNQIGSGVKLAAVNPIFSQGSLIQSESSTDLAVTGDGFFVVGGYDGQSYTRDGAFHFDKDGNLVTADGHKVLGFQADEGGRITSKLADISINRVGVEAKATAEVNMFANLDLRQAVMKDFDIKHPEKTSNFGTGVTVFDTTGTAHTATMVFNKTKDGEWTYRALIRGEEATNGKPNQMVECAKGRLVFDTNGRLKEHIEDKSSFNFNRGALADQKISFNFGPQTKDGGSGLQCTQYGTNSESYKFTQDGFEAGTIAGMSFADDGTLSAFYSNGQTVNIAQVALAKFSNSEGLYKLGGNRFRESKLSGLANVGSPSTGGRGRLSSKVLEGSTTDLAQEFINLMQAQRNFQANAKVITLSDEMLGEVINLKR